MKMKIIIAVLFGLLVCTLRAQAPTPAPRTVNPNSIIAPADSNLQSALQIMSNIIEKGAPGLTAKQVQDALGKDKVARIRAAAKAYNGK